MTTPLRIAALAGLLAASLARAETPNRRLGAPPRVDASPVGYSCTLETLLSGASCVFEGEAAPADPSAPRWPLAESARGVCAAASRPPGDVRPDADVRGHCEAEVVEALRRCGGDQATILDAAGRFVPSGRACYASLGDVMARARTLAATVAPCCRCLAGARCGKVGACLEDGLGAGLHGAEGKCATRACARVCRPYLPEPEGDPEDDSEGPAGGEKTSTPPRPATPRIEPLAVPTKDI